ncbi:hypothetical protein ACT29H_07065 [Thermophagus sp. OGC60D27]|uniref:hypothetical protein n=1 Tax=Thermophagus sp. OGC60D27 TaxID=3458415 RepID=UPI0040377147
MDDSFGEIIYIIVMLAIFIFSAFKKKKATGDNIPQSEVPHPMDEVFSPFDELLETENIDPPRVEPPKEEETVPPAHATRSSVKDYPFVKKDYVFTSNTSPEDLRRQRKNKTSYHRQTHLKSEEDLPISEGDPTASHPFRNFDLRKAVVYSEILKRPDY